jgi:hypothetical protein
MYDGVAPRSSCHSNSSENFQSYLTIDSPPSSLSWLSDPSNSISSNGTPVYIPLIIAVGFSSINGSGGGV